MTAEQTCLLPSIAEERFHTALALLQSFLDWHQACPADGERKPVEWFAHEVEGFLADPTGPRWGN